MPSLALSLMLLGLSLLLAAFAAWAFQAHGSSSDAQQAHTFDNVCWTQWPHSLVLVNQPFVPEDAPSALAYVVGVQRQMRGQTPSLMLFLSPLDIHALRDPHSIMWELPLPALATTIEMYAVPWDNVTRIKNTRYPPDTFATAAWWRDMAAEFKISTLKWQANTAPGILARQVSCPRTQQTPLWADSPARAHHGRRSDDCPLG